MKKRLLGIALAGTLAFSALAGSVMTASAELAPPSANRLPEYTPSATILMLPFPVRGPAQRVLTLVKLGKSTAAQQAFTGGAAWITLTKLPQLQVTVGPAGR